MRVRVEMKYKHQFGIGLSFVIFIPPILALFVPDTIGIAIENTTTLDLMNLFYVIAFVWVTSVAFILTDLTQSKRALREDKKSHARDIAKVFSLMSEITISTSARKLEIKIPEKETNSYIRIEDVNGYDEYYFYDEAIKHLQSYKEANKQWEKIHELVEEFNQKNLTDEDLGKVLAVAMNDEFGIKHIPNENNTSHYYEERVIRRVKNLMHPITKNHQPTLEKTDNGRGIWIIPKHATTPLIISDKDIDLDKFEEILTKLANNESLKKRYEKENKKLEIIRNEIDEFCKKLTQHIKEIKYNPLKGKCNSSCPK